MNLQAPDLTEREAANALTVRQNIANLENSGDEKKIAEAKRMRAQIIEAVRLGVIPPNEIPTAMHPKPNG